MHVAFIVSPFATDRTHCGTSDSKPTFVMHIGIPTFQENLKQNSVEFEFKIVSTAGVKLISAV